jgi:hypothetical protein
MTPHVILKNGRPRLSSAESGHIPARINERDFREEKAEVICHKYQILLEVTESIALHCDLPGLCRELAQSLRKALHFDYLSAQQAVEKGPPAFVALDRLAPTYQ